MFSMNEQMIVTFLITTLVSMALLGRRRGKPVTESTASVVSLAPKPTGPLVRALNDMLPLSAKTREELTRELLAAGDLRLDALAHFNALRVGLIAAALLLGNLLALTLPKGFEIYGTGASFVLAMLAYSLPRLFIVMKGKNRQFAFDRGLALAADLLVMSLGAGQNLNVAIKRVARDIGKSNRVIAQELDLVSWHSDLRNMSYALTRLADRIQTISARNFAMVLIQSEKIGTDTLITLTEFANSLRSAQRLQVESRANQLSFWMLLPTITCLWIAVGMILLGPAWLEIANARKIRDEVAPRNQMIEITNSNR